MRFLGLYIFTPKKLKQLCYEERSQAADCAYELSKTINSGTFSSAVCSLKELRKNTWDKTRVDSLIKTLEQFCGKD